MSKGAKGTEKENVVVLPTLPKFDDKDRKKWCQDYDKVETDLLRNHLGAPAETITLGLRISQQQPAFDRRLPSMDEPTQAEKLEAMRAASRKPRGNQSTAPGGADASLPPRAGSTDPHGRASTAMAMMHDDASSLGGTSPARRQRVSPMNVTRSMTSMDGSYRGHSSMSQHSHGGGDPLQSLSKCIKVLDTMLHPPASYKNSFRINLDGIDLTWMWHYAADRAPPQLLTVETLRDDVGGSSALGNSVKATVVNSPRSTLVMLRNGITTRDVIRRPRAYFQRTDVDEDTAEVERQHHEERRKAMLQSLREEYRELCAAVPLHDLVHGLQARHTDHINESKARASPVRRRRLHTADGSSSPTRMGRDPTGCGGGDDPEESSFAAQRKAKIQRLANKSREKMEKQLEAIAVLQREMKEAEARKKANDQMLSLRDADRKRQLEERASQAAKHFNEMREKASGTNITHIAEIEAKRQKLEAKAAAKAEAAQARAEQLKSEAELKAIAKTQRLKQNREALESLKEQELAKQAEKDMRAAEKRDQLAKRLAQEREDAALQHHKAELQRREAQERVVRQREEALQKAAAREQSVQERLESFKEAQQAERRAAMEAEAAKEHRRRQVIATSEQRLSQRLNSLEEKRHEHLRLLDAVRSQRKEEERRRHEIEHLVLDDKKYLVDRQGKCDEFNKLLKAVAMLDKEQQAEAIAAQKRQMAEMAAVEREQLRLQKEAATAKLSKLL